MQLLRKLDFLDDNVIWLSAAVKSQYLQKCEFNMHNRSNSLGSSTLIEVS